MIFDYFCLEKKVTREVSRFSKKDPIDTVYIVWHRTRTRDDYPAQDTDAYSSSRIQSFTKKKKKNS